jgi:hypothetical protein
MTPDQTPPAAERPPGDHIHFPEVAWPEPAPAPEPVARRPREIPLPIGMIEPPPMADERFAGPRSQKPPIAAYILLVLALLALVAVVLQAEGWL